METWKGAVVLAYNIQREDILPSEKAKAYSMKYEAMKHQGKKGNGKEMYNVSYIGRGFSGHWEIKDDE